MQLDILLQLCGPEVSIHSAALAYKGTGETEEQLALDVDCPQCSVVVSGPPGSLDLVFRQIAEDEGLEVFSLNDWEAGPSNRRFLRIGMQRVKEAWRLAPTSARVYRAIPKAP